MNEQDVALLATGDKSAAMMLALDMVALQRTGDTYHLLTPAPAWFREFWPGEDQRVALEGVSPFLDHFLHDAAQCWETPDERARSGPFIEQGARDVALEATALTVDGDPVLLLVNLGEDYEEQLTLLQAARENLLTRERLEAEVSLRTREIRERESEIAGRLIYAAGFRDEETGAHIRRIGLYSAEMARALGWSPTAVDDVQAAAPMHDIGKIGIPDSILLKPGRLEPDEYEIMKGHARIGAEILGGSDIAMVQMAADIAGGHHERWDGGGYPWGLAGNDIPLSARIVALVDVYDALVHARVYKPAFPEAEALAMMRAEAGKHFDPDLFDLFISRLDAMRAIREAVCD